MKIAMARGVVYIQINPTYAAAIVVAIDKMGMALETKCTMNTCQRTQRL